MVQQSAVLYIYSKVGIKATYCIYSKSFRSAWSPPKKEPIPGTFRFWITPEPCSPFSKGTKRSLFARIMPNETAKASGPACDPGGSKDRLRQLERSLMDARNWDEHRTVKKRQNKTIRMWTTQAAHYRWQKHTKTVCLNWFKQQSHDSHRLLSNKITMVRSPSTFFGTFWGSWFASTFETVLSAPSTCLRLLESVPRRSSTRGRAARRRWHWARRGVWTNGRLSCRTRLPG